MIYGLGMLEMGITMSLAQLVIDNDFAAMIRRVLKGIPVTDSSLAVDVIKRVGPRGNFIMEEHTIKYMRSEQSQPQLIDRTMRESWEVNGSKDLSQKAEEKAKEILETHKPTPLPQGVAEKLALIREDAEKELGILK
jgi:trimethylamine--corrinoid protein Co-methyltransferase